MRIFILGGTSGIGWALAQYYLQRGDTVAIAGRDLARVPVGPCSKHAELHMFEFDIGDQHSLNQAIDRFAVEGLDLLIVAAGLYFNTRSHRLDAATTLRMLNTNVSGLNHAFERAAQTMLARRAGHLVAISSIAGLLHDYPGASLYSATKRTALSVCEAYRIALAPFSIVVTAIVPGYVDTAKLRALNGGDASHKPFLVSEAQAVARIVQAIEQRKAIDVFPWQMRYLIACLNKLPRALLKLRR